MPMPIKTYDKMNNLNKLNKFLYILIIIIISIIIQNCAPVYSDLQTARTVGKNRVEIIPVYTAYNLYHEGDNAFKQYNIGIQTGYGITERFDIRFRYEVLWYKEHGDGEKVLGIGPKYSIVRDKIAFSMPIGRVLGYGYQNSWEIHPTCLFTLHVWKEKIDFTLSPKYLISLSRYGGSYPAINFNISISNNLKKWAIRPEYGILFDPGEPWFFGQCSVSLAVSFHIQELLKYYK